MMEQIHVQLWVHRMNFKADMKLKLCGNFLGRQVVMVNQNASAAHKSMNGMFW